MMTQVEREAVKVRFTKLLASPAIRKSMDFLQKYPTDPGLVETKSALMKMPSTERVDGVIKAYRSTPSRIQLEDV